MSTARLCLANINGFPKEFHSNGKISTVHFIEASYEVIGIIEKFGTLFSPVVSDMKGNVDRLLEYYKSDEDNRKFLEDLILNDDQKITHTWLLWLKRALEMIERFFWLILNDADVVNEKSNNIRPLINLAYDEVLKPYHGFFLQNGFKLINRCMPSRSTLLGSGAQLNENITQIKELQPNMRIHIDKINSLYKENDLNYHEKV